MRKRIFIERLLWLIITGLLFVLGVCSMLIFKFKNPFYVACMIILTLVVIIEIIVFINAYSDYLLEKKALKKDDKVQGLFINKRAVYRFNRSLDTEFVRAKYKVQYSFENANGDVKILETGAIFNAEQANNIENMGSFVVYKLDENMAILIYEKIAM